MKTLLVTPMQEELDHILGACAAESLQSQSSRVGRLPVSVLPELGLTLARGGTGKAQYALQTQHLLDASPDWQLVICAGAAGALIESLAIGDVVVATETIEHDYHNKFSETPLPSFKGNCQVIERLKKVMLPSADFDVHFGPIASGDEDIVALVRAKALYRQTGALAAAWEGAGGARACQFSNVPFLEIRGVTDSADHNAPADFAANLKIAMQNVAKLIISYLT